MHTSTPTTKSRQTVTNLREYPDFCIWSYRDRAGAERWAYAERHPAGYFTTSKPVSGFPTMATVLLSANAAIEQMEPSDVRVSL